MKRSVEDIINSLGIDKLTTTPHGWKGCCNINPDHIDSKPSMHINVDKGLVKCFSCDAFKFLPDYLLDNGATFDEVVDFLFRDYERTKVTPEGMQEWVLGRKIPKSMVDRGFEIPTLQHFKVGYDEVEKRITIPLTYKGVLYGVQYRQYPKKFWVSEGFIKDNFIYNYEPTENRVYTEGFTDLWRIWQNGTEEVSALLTAFPSDGQLGLMSKHKKITLALDNDIAGFKGAFKIQKELGREIEIRVALFKGKDAGALELGDWQRAINNSISFTEFEVKFIQKNVDLYNKIKKQIYGNNYN